MHPDEHAFQFDGYRIVVQDAYPGWKHVNVNDAQHAEMAEAARRAR